MPALYCKKSVVGSSFTCVLIVCIIFLVAPIATVITTYEFIGASTMYFGYVPLFLCSLAIIYLFLLTSLTDPGVFPRNDEVKIVPNSPASHFADNEVCRTCNITKPPGTAHCSDCGHCVVYQDHHCPWMGTCIGLRNYFYFVLSCLGASLYTLVLIIYNCVGIYFVVSQQYSGMFGDSFTNALILIMFTIFAVFGLFFGMSMFISNVNLIKTDFTTRAEIRNRANVKQSLKQKEVDQNLKGDVETV